MYNSISTLSFTQGPHHISSPSNTFHPLFNKHIFNAHSISILSFPQRPHRRTSRSSTSILSFIHHIFNLHSIPILTCRAHRHHKASLSHSSPTHSPARSHSISILSFNNHPHHSTSLSRFSNLINNLLSFHLHSHFQQQSSSLCISLLHVQSLLYHSYIHSLFPSPFSVYKPSMIVVYLSSIPLIHSACVAHSISILPFKTNSSSQCISLSRFSNPFSVSLSFHSHSSFQNQSSSLCISLSRSSNPFYISLSFHFHSHSSTLSSSLCISLILFPSLLHHSHIHFLTSFHLSLSIAILLAQ